MLNDVDSYKKLDFNPETQLRKEVSNIFGEMAIKGKPGKWSEKERYLNW